MGADRPGLVAQLAACVADYGGNWVESRLVRLGGQFAGVLRVEVPEADADRLAKAVQGLEEAGLRSLSMAEEAPVRAGQEPRLVRMELLGSDRQGILKAISNVLARHLVNIEELSTERRTAPMTGEPLFEAKAIVNVPSASVLQALRGDLEKIAGDLLVDLLFAEATHGPT